MSQIDSWSQFKALVRTLTSSTPSAPAEPKPAVEAEPVSRVPVDSLVCKTPVQAPGSGIGVLGQAIALVTKQVQAGDHGFVDQLRQHPEQALGGLWHGLSSEERAQFEDPAFVETMVANLHPPFDRQERLEGIRDMFSALVSTGADGERLRGAFASGDPALIEKALKDTGLWGKLDPKVQEDLCGETIIPRTNRARLSAIVRSEPFQQVMRDPAAREKLQDAMEAMTERDYSKLLFGGNLDRLLEDPTSDATTSSILEALKGLTQKLGGDGGGWL